MIRLAVGEPVRDVRPPPNSRTSAITWCVVVKPLWAPRTGTPRVCSACASVWALATMAAMYCGPNSSSSAAAAASAATRLTWWVAASAGKTASSSGGVSSKSFHTITPDCGPENVLPALPVSTAAPSASGSWNWPPAIRPSWCAPSKKTFPPHSCAIVRDLADREREQGHARAERDQLRAGLLGRDLEGFEVDLELDRCRTGRRRCSGRGCRPGRRGGCSSGRRPAAGSSSPCRRAA